MAPLDCNTPRGRDAITRQHAIVDACAREWHVDAWCTDDTAACPIDAVFGRDGRLLAIAEVRSRDMLLAGLRGFGSYLVTFDKLVVARELARQLHVPFVLIVGLLDAVVWWRIADADGTWRASMTIDRTITQATINGGIAERANAYVALDDMVEVSRAD